MAKKDEFGILDVIAAMLIILLIYIILKYGFNLF